ncbi:flavin-containing monooxygenase [Domibacillus mangrovi]|uniref:Oxidoreductase n=1 Tax=Domibacillus mangrovi TaxID=1714354 RepID=A0A1Q5P6R9_9BACI|nr:NAD(P)/FAD-dependent oxidoreductase [Domibacillus mangrovi]OKL37937.1 oxidoreductase [Domibacillus mangrovi]
MYQTIIIGAGQAGLAMGYYLKEMNQSFLILDKNQEIGDEWRNRYDSLVLFTPRMYSSLPGLSLTGDPQGFPMKDEIANYLEYYSNHFELPVQLRTEVLVVRKEMDHFFIKTEDREYKAENIVVASGPFQKPNIPLFAKSLSSDVLQIHSSQYKNPQQLRSGNVLVVGGGNSGAQIAVELSNERKTYLSISQKIKFFPLEIGNKSIFWWFDKAGILKAPRHSWIAKKIQASGDPIFGSELKGALASQAVVQKSRAVDGEDTKIRFQDQSMLEVHNIVWSTGFVWDYSWLEVNGVLNYEGRPIHKRGITQTSGLYFLGLPWQYRRGSTLLQGVGEDAKYIAEHIQKSGGTL